MPGRLFRAWRAEIGAGRRRGAQPVLSRRDLPAGLQGPQAGDAPPAARPPCAADRPCRPPRGDRHDGPVAGRRGHADRERRRRAALRAGRSFGSSASSPRRRCRSKTPPASSARCRSAFPKSRRRPPNRSATPPPTARRRSRKRPPGADLFLVVGAPNSSNSTAPGRGRRARRREDVAAGAARRPRFRGRTIGAISTLGLSAGASAPEIIVDEIIDAFRERFDVTVELAVTATETEEFPGHARAARRRTHQGRHGLRERLTGASWRSIPTFPKASSKPSCRTIRRGGCFPTRASPRVRKTRISCSTPRPAPSSSPSTRSASTGTTCRSFSG